MIFHFTYLCFTLTYYDTHHKHERLFLCLHHDAYDGSGFGVSYGFIVVSFAVSEMFKNYVMYASGVC